MSGGWTPESWDPVPWDSDPWADGMPSRRDSWTDAYSPVEHARSDPAGPSASVVVLAASGGAVAATVLGLVVLLLGGAVVALIVGAMVLLGACAVGSAYLRGAR